MLDAGLAPTTIQLHHSALLSFLILALPDLPDPQTSDSPLPTTPAIDLQLVVSVLTIDCRLYPSAEICDHEISAPRLSPLELPVLLSQAFSGLLSMPKYPRHSLQHLPAADEPGHAAQIGSHWLFSRLYRCRK